MQCENGRTPHHKIRDDAKTSRLLRSDRIDWTYQWGSIHSGKLLISSLFHWRRTEIPSAGDCSFLYLMAFTSKILTPPLFQVMPNAIISHKSYIILRRGHHNQSQHSRITRCTVPCHSHKTCIHNPHRGILKSHYHNHNTSYTIIIKYSRVNEINVHKSAYHA